MRQFLVSVVLLASLCFGSALLAPVATAETPQAEPVAAAADAGVFSAESITDAADLLVMLGTGYLGMQVYLMGHGIGGGGGNSGK